MGSRTVRNLGTWFLAVAAAMLAGLPALAQEGAHPPPAPTVTPVPLGPLLGIAAMAVLLFVLVWGVWQPLAWIIVSFLAIGAGVGCAGYGLLMYVMFVNRNPPLRHGEIEELMIFMAAGAGALVAGIVLLLVALARHRKKAVPSV